jgi:hypothetical protein
MDISIKLPNKETKIVTVSNFKKISNKPVLNPEVSREKEAEKAVAQAERVKDEEAQAQAAQAARIQDEEAQAQAQAESEAARVKAEEAQAQAAQAERVKDEEAQAQAAQAERVKAEEAQAQAASEAARIQAEEAQAQAESEAARVKAEEAARIQAAQAERVKAEEAQAQAAAEAAQAAAEARLQAEKEAMLQAIAVANEADAAERAELAEQIERSHKMTKQEKKTKMVEKVKELVEDLNTEQYTKSEIPGDGWCSMHAVDSLFQLIGIPGYEIIPVRNEVPSTLHHIVKPENSEGLRPGQQDWYRDFIKNSTLWASESDPNFYSSPMEICTYINKMTKGQYECFKEIHHRLTMDIPNGLIYKQTYNFKDIIDILLTGIDPISYQYPPEFFGELIANDKIVIFLNNGDHWDLIHSTKIKRITDASIPEPELEPEPLQLRADAEALADTITQEPETERRLKEISAPAGTLIELNRAELNVLEKANDNDNVNMDNDKRKKALKYWYNNKLHLNFTNSEGLTFNDLIDRDYDWWERTHNYIQWIFPSPDASAHNAKGPILDSDVKDYLPIKNIELSLDKYKQFLMNHPKYEYGKWPSEDHNYLRITRILTFLNFMDLYDYAIDFYSYCIRILGHKVNSKSLNFWNEQLLRPHSKHSKVLVVCSALRNEYKNRESDKEYIIDYETYGEEIKEFIKKITKKSHLVEEYMLGEDDGKNGAEFPKDINKKYDVIWFAGCNFLYTIFPNVEVIKRLHNDYLEDNGILIFTEQQTWTTGKTGEGVVIKEPYVNVETYKAGKNKIGNIDKIVININSCFDMNTGSSGEIYYKKKPTCNILGGGKIKSKKSKNKLKKSKNKLKKSKNKFNKLKKSKNKFNKLKKSKNKFKKFKKTNKKK